jgi:hypothetical protein
MMTFFADTCGRAASVLAAACLAIDSNRRFHSTWSNERELHVLCWVEFAASSSLTCCMQSRIAPI